MSRPAGLLRLCNKHLKGRVDDLVAAASGRVSRCRAEALTNESRIDALVSAGWKVKRLKLMYGHFVLESEAGLNCFFAAFQSFEHLKFLELREFKFEKGALPALKALQNNQDVFLNFKNCR